MKQDINNHVLITASSKGLGKAMAIEFASNGFNIIINGRNKDKVENTYNEIININSKKIKCETVIGDLRSNSTINKLYKASIGKIAILINNAAIPCYGTSLDKMTNSQIYESIETNLIAPIKLTRKIYPLLKEQCYGSIININSIVGKEPKKYRSVHSAAKWGLKGFTKSLRIEASRYNVDLINIYPSRIKTIDDFSYGLQPNIVASEIFRSYSSSILEKIIDGRPDEFKP